MKVFAEKYESGRKTEKWRGDSSHTQKNMGIRLILSSVKKEFMIEFTPIHAFP